MAINKKITHSVMIRPSVQNIDNELDKLVAAVESGIKPTKNVRQMLRDSLDTMMYLIDLIDEMEEE